MKYICRACNWLYDEIKEGTKFEDLEEDWKCPICGQLKLLFIKYTDNDKNNVSY